MRTEPQTRIGTRDRDDAIAVLGIHFTAGRLSIVEFDERLTSAATAVVIDDLRHLFVDLPAPHPLCLAPYHRLPPYGQREFATPPGYLTWSPKSRIVAALLQILLPFGAGRLYTGHHKTARAQLLVALCSFGLGGVVWCWADAIVLLTTQPTDALQRLLRP